LSRKATIALRFAEAGEEAVDKYGDPKGKRAILRQLNDIDHRLATLGEAAAEPIARIEGTRPFSPCPARPARSGAGTESHGHTDHPKQNLNEEWLALP
jgi:hypothetical protein